MPRAWRPFLKCCVQVYGTAWAPHAVGHRVVHGYEQFTGSCRIDDQVLADLEARQYLAPLHNPVNILGIRAALAIFPGCAPGRGIRYRLSPDHPPARISLCRAPFLVQNARGPPVRFPRHQPSVCHPGGSPTTGNPLAESAFVSAHLGNGCSATSVRNGMSLDTSMGMTPLEGLIMGTRSGDVDPSLHSYLIERMGIRHQDVTNLLNQQSGLLGVSGLSNDMRELLDASDRGHEGAILAVEMFAYKAAKVVASLVVPLGRLDAVVFTGGIGEYSWPVRGKIVEHLRFLDLELDSDRNRAHGADSCGVVTRKSHPAAIVVKTDEERMIAMDTAALIAETEK